MSNTKKSQLSKKVHKTASIQTPLEPEDDLKYEVVTLWSTSEVTTFWYNLLHVIASYYHTVNACQCLSSYYHTVNACNACQVTFTKYKNTFNSRNRINNGWLGFLMLNICLLTLAAIARGKIWFSQLGSFRRGSDHLTVLDLVTVRPANSVHWVGSPSWCSPVDLSIPWFHDGKCCWKATFISAQFSLLRVSLFTPNAIALINPVKGTEITWRRIRTKLGSE